MDFKRVQNSQFGSKSMGDDLFGAGLYVLVIRHVRLLMVQSQIYERVKLKKFQKIPQIDKTIMIEIHNIKKKLEVGVQKAKPQRKVVRSQVPSTPNVSFVDVSKLLKEIKEKHFIVFQFKELSKEKQELIKSKGLAALLGSESKEIKAQKNHDIESNKDLMKFAIRKSKFNFNCRNSLIT